MITQEKVEAILKNYGIYVFHINGNGIIIENDFIHTIPEKDVNTVTRCLLEQKEPKYFRSD